MNKKEYIQSCGASSAKDLKADQILDFFIAGYGGMQNRISAMLIKGGAFGMKPDRAKGIAMLRQAFELDKVLEVNFIDGEGVSDGKNTIPAPHFTMKFRKS